MKNKKLTRLILLYYSSTAGQKANSTVNGLTRGTNARWIGCLQRCPHLSYERVATLVTHVVAEVVKIQSPEHGSSQTSINDVFSLWKINQRRICYFVLTVKP